MNILAKDLAKNTSICAILPVFLFFAVFPKL